MTKGPLVIVCHVETGDDAALAFMDKGYEARDIMEQCARLDAVGIGYAFFYLAGISGGGRGIEGATVTAETFNRTHPWLIGANMLTVYESSRLSSEMEAGRWEEEVETEKYREVRELVRLLEVPVGFAMLGASNPVMLRGKPPEQREQIMTALDSVIADIGEGRLRSYRTRLRHL